MKIISPKIHMVLDYLMAIFLVIAPQFINFSEKAATFSMVLGGIHFLLTILTKFKGGIVKLVPFRIHGVIEFLVTVALAVLSFTIFRNSMTDHFFFACLALVILIVFLLTDYKAEKA